MNGPIEPAADLRSFAGLLHQTFIALTNEGFSESQALTIIGHVLTASTGGVS